MVIKKLRDFLNRLSSSVGSGEPTSSPNSAQGKNLPSDSNVRGAYDLDPDEVDDEIVPRTAEEAAERLLAILAVVGRAHQPEDARKWWESHGIENYLSPCETSFVNNPSPTDSEMAAFSWRAEGAVSIVWALGGLSAMPPPNRQFDLFQVEMVRDAMSSPSKFLATAQLRPEQEIEELESDIYHQHWRVRDAQLFQKEMPPELDPEIVYERRYALSWLVGWGSCWDDVPTDT